MADVFISLRAVRSFVVAYKIGKVFKDNTQVQFVYTKKCDKKLANYQFFSNFRKRDKPNMKKFFFLLFIQLFVVSTTVKN